MDRVNGANKELEEVAMKLSGAKDDNRENANQKAMKLAIESMQRQYTGVLGRLSDLCQPKQVCQPVSQFVMVHHHVAIFLC
mgnify:CR=1 FL=1